MKRFAEQLKKQSATVRLRAAEKRELKERLVAYMEYHPLPQTMAVPPATERLQSEPFSLLNLNTFEIRSLLGTFAVLLLIFVPVVAERSVPGDVLYPVKVNFNEEIRSSLSTSPYAKVEWETERLNRRIAEARLLASEGKLTEEAEADVAAAVKEHSDAAQKGIAELRESDQDEAAIAEIAFESALIVQSEVLEKELAKEVAANVGTEVVPGRSVAILASAIADAQASVTENQSGVVPSYEKLSVRIEQETTRAYELFDSIKRTASAAEVNDVERRLADIERKIVESANVQAGELVVEEVASSTPDEVVVPAEITILRGALSDLQKLIRFMTDIDVRTSVTVEELVPVTLTDAELKDKFSTAQAEAERLKKVVTAALDAGEAEAVAEKLQNGLAAAEVEVTAAKKAAELAKHTRAVLLSEGALALLRDLESMLSDRPEEEALEVAPALPVEVVATTSSSTATSTEVETAVDVEAGS